MLRHEFEMPVRHLNGVVKQPFGGYQWKDEEQKHKFESCRYV